jgi:hypothetical protein
LAVVAAVVAAAVVAAAVAVAALQVVAAAVAEELSFRSRPAPALTPRPLSGPKRRPSIVSSRIHLLRVIIELHVRTPRCVGSFQGAAQYPLFWTTRQDNILNRGDSLIGNALICQGYGEKRKEEAENRSEEEVG